MKKIYTVNRLFTLLAVLTVCPNLSANTLPAPADWMFEIFENGEPVLTTEPLAAVGMSNTEIVVSDLPTGDSIEIFESFAPDGHLKCIIRKTVNCATKTVKLESFTQNLFNGNQLTAITVNWNSGQFANNITIVPPGFWSYDDSSFGCDHHENSIQIDEAFFPGPLTITGPAILCAGETGTLNVNVNGYVFPTVTWDPENPSGQVSPFDIPGAGTYNLSVIDQFDCPFNATKTVQQSPPVVPIIQGPIFMCSTGKTATLTVNPVTTQYYWQNGATTQSITVNAPGGYSVTTTNQYGCTGETSWEVNPADIDSIFGSISVPAICPGTPSTIQIIGGPYPSLVWSNGAIGQTITVTQPGTYTVVATNPYGCTAARQFTINPAPQPAPALNSPSICPNTAATLSVSGGNFSTFNWSSGQNSPTISVSTPGNYTVTVGDATGCTGTATTTVQAAPAAVPTVAGLAAVCSPASATIQASGGFTNYQWTTPSGSSPNTPSVEATQSGTYTVLVTNSAGCTGSASHVFTVNQSPSPTVAVAPYLCNGQFSLSANAGFSTYQWSSGESTQNINATSNGNYSVTVSTAAGCTGTTVQNISIPPPPATNITGVSALCVNVSGQLAAAGGYPTYQWSNGFSGATITVPAPGTYTVTATDQFGCTTTAERTVNPSPPLQPGIAGPLQICINSTGTLSVVGSFGSVAWSSGQNSASIPVTAAGNYTVTVTNPDGCTGTATHALTVGTGLSPQVVAAPYLCDGKMTISAGQGFSTYQWTTNATTPTITVNASGSFAVTVTDATGCTGADQIQVNIPLPPGVAIAGDTDLCVGETTTLSATAGYPTYAWSSGENSPTISTGAAGAYAVTVTDQFGCTAAASLGVQIFPPSMPAVVGPTVICQNDDAVLATNAPFTSYLWSTGATTATISVFQNGNYAVTVTDAVGCTATAAQGLVVNPAPVPTTAQNLYDCDGSIDLTAIGNFASFAWSNGSQTATSVATATGNYIVTVSDAIGCTGTAVEAVVIPADPQVSIQTAQPFCFGGSGQLQASGNFSNYAWSSGQATTGITVNTAGDYSLTVADQFGCTAIATTTVSVLPLPTPVIAGPPEVCAGATFPLTVSGGIYTAFAWSDGSSNASANISFPGNYIVTVTDQNGCKNSASFTIQTGTPPDATAGTDQTLTCVIPTVQLSGTGSTTGAGIQYQWIAPTGLPVPGGTVLNITVSQAGDYRLVVTNLVNGCTADDLVTVALDANIPVVEPGSPNVLTCTTTSLELDGTGTSTGADFQYLWTTSGTGNIVSGATTLSPTIDKPGIYQLLVTNTTNNCTAAKTVEITQNVQPPVINVGAQETLTCTAPAQTIQAQTVSSSSQNLTYSWTTVGGKINSGANSPAPIVAAAGTYTVLVTDESNGCTGTATKTMIEDKVPPVAAIAQPQELTCILKNQVLDGSQSSANMRYRWTTPDGNIVSGNQTNSATIDEPGEYQLIVTNLTNGCADTTLVEVTQNVIPPSANAGQTGILTCKTTSLQLNGSASNVNGATMTYLWTAGAGGQIIAGNTTLTPTVGDAAIYTLLVTDNSNGCTRTATVGITENVAPPVVSIALPDILTCVEKTASVQATASATGTAPTILWTTSTGNILTPTDALGISVDAPGIYQILVTNNENGCTDTRQIEVKQNIAPPPVSVGTPLLLTCSRLAVDLLANFANGLKVEWTTTDGQILSGATSAKPSVGKIGTYNVLVTNPIDGCTNTAQVVVDEEKNKPSALQFEMLPPDCTGKKGTVRFDTVVGGVQPLVFSVDGGKTFFDKKQFGNLKPGDYELVVQDANGCEHLQPMNVPEPPKPGVSLPPTFDLEFGDSLRLEPQLPPMPPGFIDEVIWSPLTSLTFEDTTLDARLRPFAKPFKTTTYTLTVVTPEGCEATARATVRVFPPGIYVPNVITPYNTQDGNSGFTIFANPKAVVRIEKLLVFDRWGDQVFENFGFPPNDPSLGWQGDIKKKPANPAVFVWHAEVLMSDGTLQFLKGDVALVR